VDLWIYPEVGNSMFFFPKLWYLSTKPHGITSKKATILIESSLPGYTRWTDNEKHGDKNLLTGF